MPKGKDVAVPQVPVTPPPPHPSELEDVPVVPVDPAPRPEPQPGEEVLRESILEDAMPAPPDESELRDEAPRLRPAISPDTPAAVYLEPQRKDNHAADVPPPDNYEDDRDDLTRAIGARYFVMNHVFEWAKDRGGFRHTFTRFYPEPENVLLDKFTDDTKAVRAEVREKARAIHDRNLENPLNPIGYLPTIVGDTVTFEAIERAKAGALLDLPTFSEARL